MSAVGPSVADRAALVEVLRAHRPKVWTFGYGGFAVHCSCGWEHEGDESYTDHLAALPSLAPAGETVTERVSWTVTRNNSTTIFGDREDRARADYEHRAKTLRRGEVIRLERTETRETYSQRVTVVAERDRGAR